MKSGGTNDQCRSRGKDIEKAFEGVIGRGARQLKPGLQGPKGIDNSKRQITPLSFIEGFQSINARFLELRLHKALKKLRIERARSLSKDDTAGPIAKVVQFRCEVSLHDRRSLAGDGLAHVLVIYIDEFELLAV